MPTNECNTCTTTPCPDPTIPCVLAVEWRCGMAVPPDTLVIHNGLTYFNKKQGDPNTDDPAESDDYSKALKGANVIKYLVTYFA